MQAVGANGAPTLADLSKLKSKFAINAVGIAGSQSLRHKQSILFDGATQPSVDDDAFVESNH